jgi:hypothetical protein
MENKALHCFLCKSEGVFCIWEDDKYNLLLSLCLICFNKRQQDCVDCNDFCHHSYQLERSKREDSYAKS